MGGDGDKRRRDGLAGVAGGQARCLQDLLDVVRAVPDGHGAGVVWWYPEAVAVPGLFVWGGGSLALFDDHGDVLPAAVRLAVPDFGGARPLSPESVRARRLGATGADRTSARNKPSSVPVRSRAGGGSFIWDRRCRRPRAAYPGLGRSGPPLVPYVALLRVGFTMRPRHQEPGALLPHPFTLACAASRRPSAVCSLWHFPSPLGARALPGTLPCGARTFLRTRPKPARAILTRTLASCYPRGATRFEHTPSGPSATGVALPALAPSLPGRMVPGGRTDRHRPTAPVFLRCQT